MSDASVQSAPNGQADEGAAGSLPADLARVRRDTVAVVAASADGAAVWHIDVGPDIGLARPCGAWLLDPADDAESIRVLTQGRRVLATETGKRVLQECGASFAGLVDAEATVRGARDEIDALQRSFDEELRRSGRSLVGPSWPAIPDPPSEGGEAADTRSAAPADGTETALWTGRWLADLADAWQQVEGQRRQRDFLRAYSGEDRRSLPVVCRSAG